MWSPQESSRYLGRFTRFEAFLLIERLRLSGQGLFFSKENGPDPARDRSDRHQRSTCSGGIAGRLVMVISYRSARRIERASRSDLRDLPANSPRFMALVLPRGGPGDRPPCIRQRSLPRIGNARHGRPPRSPRVRAPHRDAWGRSSVFSMPPSPSCHADDRLTTGLHGDVFDPHRLRGPCASA